MSNEKKPEIFKFSVDNKPLESEHAHLTGAQIKALAQVDPTYGLQLEGHGHDPDRFITDSDLVDLSKPGREHFHAVPPATYGGSA
jgi:hypothetical protein